MATRSVCENANHTEPAMLATEAARERQNGHLHAGITLTFSKGLP